MRERAERLVGEACEWATALGAGEVVVWSAFCGYDYSFQCDYDTIWERNVHAFRRVCDKYPTVKISLEYKPTDENTRFFAVPSTAAAIMLAQVCFRQFQLVLHCTDLHRHIVFIPIQYSRSNVQQYHANLLLLSFPPSYVFRIGLPGSGQEKFRPHFRLWALSHGR